MNPKLPFESGHCLCGSCGEYFVSDRPFTRHREDGVCGKPNLHALLSKGFKLVELKTGQYWYGGGM